MNTYKAIEALLHPASGTPAPLQPAGIYALPSKTFLSVSGVDAEKFLQSQISSDLGELTDDNTQVSSHSTPKGRMISSFRLYKQAGDFYLLMDQSLQAQALAAFGKYIVFSKAEIVAVEDAFILGCHGDQALLNLEETLGKINTAQNAITHTEQATVITLNEKLKAFEIIIRSTDVAEKLISALSQSLTVLNEDRHKLIEHETGLSFVNADTTDLFIAQMLNYQAIGGISFTKGCYTGQEIIARMKYLGKLKRRLYHCQIETSHTFQEGASISLEAGGSNQGNIASQVQVSDNRLDAMVVLTENATKPQTLYIDNQPVRLIAILSLPYSLEDK